MLSQVTAAAASFFTCWLAIVALRPLAIAVDLVDRPGGHKIHHGDIPVVGGLAMFLGIVLGMGLLPLPGPSSGAFLAACAILVTVGLIDDRFDLSPWTRLPGQIAAAVVLVLASFGRLRQLQPDNNGERLNIGRTQKNSRRCG